MIKRIREPRRKGKGFWGIGSMIHQLVASCGTQLQRAGCLEASLRIDVRGLLAHWPFASIGDIWAYGADEKSRSFDRFKHC